MAAEIKITVVFDKAGGGIADAEKDLDGLSRSAEDAGGGFSALSEIGIGALRKLGELGIGLAIDGLKALGGVIQGGIDDARENAKIQAQTAAVIKSTGQAAGVTAQQVADYASSLSAAAGESLFDDAQIQQSENLLLTFTNIKGSALEAATAMSVDMAQALGGAPKDAAIQLGKALNDPVKGISALSRVGVTFTQDQKDMIQAMVDTGDTAGAQQVILAELNKEFGGSAEAAAKADGGMAQFKDRMGEAAESIGTAVLPLLGMLAGFLNDTLAPAIEVAAATFAAWLSDPATQAAIAQVTDAIKNGLAVAFDFIANTAIPALLDAWANLQPAIAFVQGLFTQAGDGAGTLGTALGQLSGVWSSLQTVVASVGAAYTAIIEAVLPIVQNFIDQHGAQIGAIVKKLWDTFIMIVDAALQLYNAVVPPILTAIATFIQENSDTISAIFDNVWTVIYSIIDTALTLIQGIITSVMQLIHGDFSGALETLRVMSETVWTNIKNAISAIWNTIVLLLSGVWADIKTKALIAWELVRTTVQTYLNTQLTNFQTGLAAIVTAIVTFFTNAYNSFTTGLANVKTNWDTFWGTLKTAFQGILDSIVGYVVQTFEGVKNAILSAVGGLRSAASGVADGIVSGITSGISDGASRIISAAKDAALSALHAAEAALGIGSPSKVFAEGIGLPMAQGMAVGLASGAGLVARAAESTADAAMGGGRQATYNQQRALTYAPVYNNSASEDPAMDAAFARSLAGAF